MSSMHWFEDQVEQRRQIRARSLEIRRKRRQKVRGLARVALVMMLVALGVLALEIGRKAVTVMHNALAVERTTAS